MMLTREALRVVGKLGTSLSNRAHRENLRIKTVFITKYLPPQTLQYSFHENMKNLKLTQSKRRYRN